MSQQDLIVCTPSCSCAAAACPHDTAHPSHHPTHHPRLRPILWQTPTHAGPHSPCPHTPPPATPRWPAPLLGHPLQVHITLIPCVNLFFCPLWGQGWLWGVIDHVPTPTPGPPASHAPSAESPAPAWPPRAQPSRARRPPPLPCTAPPHGACARHACARSAAGSVVNVRRLRGLPKLLAHRMCAQLGCAPGPVINISGPPFHPQPMRLQARIDQNPMHAPGTGAVASSMHTSSRCVHMHALERTRAGVHS